MKKIITVAAVLAAMALPAVALANASSVARWVGRQFATQIRNRAALSGIRIVNTRVTCRADGGSRYSCLGTYTGLIGGQRVKYGIYINVNDNMWRTVGNAFVMSG